MDKELILYVYNRSFQLLGIIDNYISLIWTERYDDIGEFEMKTIYDDRVKFLMQQERFVTIDMRNRFCIVEKVEPTSKKYPRKAGVPSKQPLK